MNEINVFTIQGRVINVDDKGMGTYLSHQSFITNFAAFTSIFVNGCHIFIKRF